MVSRLRLATIAVSTALHGAIAFSMVAQESGGPSFEAGDGTAVFHLDQGIALEGTSAAEPQADAAEAAREVQHEAQMAQPAQAAEVRPVEDPPPETATIAEPPPVPTENSEPITAKAEPVDEQEILRETPETPKQPLEVAAADPTPPPIVIEEKVAAKKSDGGDPTLRMAYLGKLYSRIEKMKINPNSRDSGTVVVRFTVDAAGQLVSREVETSSGSKRLDAAAIAAVERGVPYPAFPSGLGDKNLVVTVPFRFQTR